MIRTRVGDLYSVFTFGFCNDYLRYFRSVNTFSNSITATFRHLARCRGSTYRRAAFDAINFQLISTVGVCIGGSGTTVIRRIRRVFFYGNGLGSIARLKSKSVKSMFKVRAADSRTVYGTIVHGLLALAAVSSAYSKRIIAVILHVKSAVFGHVNAERRTTTIAVNNAAVARLGVCAGVIL